MFGLDNRDDFKEIFETIALRSLGQNCLAYGSTNLERDGVYREIRIRHRDRNFRVRAGQGYYAASEDVQ